MYSTLKSKDIGDRPVKIISLHFDFFTFTHAIKIIISICITTKEILRFFKMFFKHHDFVDIEY